METAYYSSSFSGFIIKCISYSVEIIQQVYKFRFTEVFMGNREETSEIVILFLRFL